MSSALRLYLNDLVETLKTKLTLVLSGFLQTQGISIDEAIEEIYTFISDINESSNGPYVLQKLILQGNHIRDIPASFRKIARNLVYLDLHENELASLGAILEACPRLEMLDVSSNGLMVLPREMVHLSELRVLNLEHNLLKYLPPSIADLPHLQLIELANNPLVLPPIETVQTIRTQGSESEYLSKLRTYLQSNSAAIYAEIDEQYEGIGRSFDPAAKSRPLMMRSKSVSEKPRASASSSKASRRMGLVLKKPLPDESLDLGSSAPMQNASFYFDDAQNDLKPVVLSASAAELTFNVGSLSTPAAPATVGTTTSSTGVATSSTSGSPSSSFTALPHSGSYTNLTTPGVSRPSSRNRSRSNTLKEIDRILDKQEITDIEQKSGAYFRRLSTLQELPQDELMMHSGYQNSNNLFVSMSSTSTLSSSQSSLSMPQSTTAPSSIHSTTHLLTANGAASSTGHTTPGTLTSRQHNLGHQVKLYKDHPPQQQHASTGLAGIPNPVSSTISGSTVASHDNSPVVLAKGGPTFEISPIKNQFLNSQQGNIAGAANVSKKLRDPSLTLRVSRKILFSFMELQSSIRRFTGFCVDKKLTMKMVQFLYSNKSIMESLVENLEQMEDQGNNIDQVLQSLQLSITQFKQIMELLGENLPSFVMKTDVCFIRLLYLSLYGTFNELFNGYRALVPNHKPPLFSLPSQYQQTPSGTTFTLDPKQKPPVTEAEDVDERLYRALESSINIAQVVFDELTSALHKNPLPSPPVAGGSASEATTGTPGGGASNTKMRELNAVCLTAMDITKRLRATLATIRNNPSLSVKRAFWDDVNLFLKSIIQFFSSVKPIMKEGTAFYEIRPSMAILTKHTKDVTVLLEVSSYKTMSLEASSSVSAQPHTQPVLLTPITASHPLQQSYSSAVNLAQSFNAAAAGSGNGSIVPPPARTPLVAGMQTLLLLQLNAESSSSPAFASPNSVSNMPAQQPSQ